MRLQSAILCTDAFIESDNCLCQQFRLDEFHVACKSLIIWKFQLLYHRAYFIHYGNYWRRNLTIIKVFTHRLRSEQRADQFGNYSFSFRNNPNPGSHVAVVVKFSFLEIILDTNSLNKVIYVHWLLWSYYAEFNLVVNEKANTSWHYAVLCLTRNFTSNLYSRNELNDAFGIKLKEINDRWSNLFLFLYLNVVIYIVVCYGWDIYGSIGVSVTCW